jgi:pilus assembly protein Flp/PilA
MAPGLKYNTSILKIIRRKHMTTTSCLKFIKDEDGASIVEYGLLVLLIAVACVTIVTTLGTEISQSFSSSADVVR